MVDGPYDFSLTRTQTGWRLPLRGFQVTQCCVDYAISFVLLPPTGAPEPSTLRLRISTWVELVSEGRQVARVDPESDPQLLAPFLGLHLAVVEDATMRDDGSLTLRFDRGSVHVPSDPHDEAWQLVGPAGVLIVCGPGSAAPAIWATEVDARTESRGD